MTKEEIKKCYKDLEEPLRTIKSGWFRNLNSIKLSSLQKLYEYYTDERLNINCLKCIKRGLIYVKGKEDEIY